MISSFSASVTSSSSCSISVTSSFHSALVILLLAMRSVEWHLLQTSSTSFWLGPSGSDWASAPGAVASNNKITGTYRSSFTRSPPPQQPRPDPGGANIPKRHDDRQSYSESGFESMSEAAKNVYVHSLGISCP